MNIQNLATFFWDFPVFKTSDLDHFSPAWVPHSTCSDTITNLGLWSNLNRHILHWRRSAHDLKCLYHVYVHIHIYTYIHIIISISVTSKSIILSSVSPPTKKEPLFWASTISGLTPRRFSWDFHGSDFCSIHPPLCSRLRRKGDWPWYLHRVRHPATSRTPVVELPVAIWWSKSAECARKMRDKTDRMHVWHSMTIYEDMLILEKINHGTFGLDISSSSMPPKFLPRQYPHKGSCCLGMQPHCRFKKRRRRNRIK